MATELFIQPVSDQSPKSLDVKINKTYLLFKSILKATFQSTRRLQFWKSDSVLYDV